MSTVWGGSAKRLSIDYNDVKLSDRLLFQRYEREIKSNVIRVYDGGSVLVTVYDYDGQGTES